MPKGTQQLNIFVKSYRISLILTLVVIVLTAINIVGVCLQYILDFRQLDRIIALFNLGDDSSIPTYFASLNLLFAAILILPIAIIKKNNQDTFFRHWICLSLIFFGFSLDEIVMIHENLGDLLGLSFNSSWLYYSWVVIAIPAIIIITLSYSQFLLHLPNRIRYLFLLAGSLFILGGLGMEMLSARHDSFHGTNNLIYNWIMIAEEFLEMIGIVVFTHALLEYLKLQILSINFNFPQKNRKYKHLKTLERSR